MGFCLGDGIGFVCGPWLGVFWGFGWVMLGVVGRIVFGCCSRIGWVGRFVKGRPRVSLSVGPRPAAGVVLIG